MIAASPDVVVPFQLDKMPVRGRLVRLDDLMRKIIAQHSYPEVVNRYLGEAVALSLALVNCFKFDGLFTFQISAAGPLHLLVVDITREGHIRACARYHDDQLKSLRCEDLDKVQCVFGAGHLAFTIEPQVGEDRYQGIVELTGTTLAECLHHFFRQSEQLETGIIVASQWPASTSMVAGALMIQRMPVAALEDSQEKEEADDGWFRALSLLGTTTSEELLNPTLSENVLLYRLFWEEGIRINSLKPYKAQCRCNREKIQGMLENFDELSRKEMVIDGKIEVNCEFCGVSYTFQETDIRSLIKRT
jgi:molecular chaperone Hsp33